MGMVSKQDSSKVQAVRPGSSNSSSSSSSSSGALGNHALLTQLATDGCSLYLR
jgi:hypothetical protein